MSYENSKIYTIRSFQTDKYYIGSTTNELIKRLNQHRINYKRYKNTKYNYVSSFDILQYEDHYIELLELYSCNNRDELNKKEYEMIKLYKDHIVNKYNGRTNNRKEYNKDYRKTNIKQIKENKKEYYSKNKEQIKERAEKWNKEHKEYLKEYRKNYHIKNKHKSKKSEELDINHNTGGVLSPI